MLPDTLDMTPSFPYDPEVARVVAARFIMHAGGRMNYTKLMKLMYLLERWSLVVAGGPVLGGRYVAMNNGPLISEAYDAVKFGKWTGITKDEFDVVWIGDDDEVVDYLSAREEEMIAALSKRFHSADFGDMIHFTHNQENCPEWAAVYKPNTSCRISLRDIPGCNAEELEVYAQEMAMFAGKR